MIPLRQVFLVEKLRIAASQGKSAELKIIREIIKEIKKAQLDKKVICTDDMVMEVLEKLLREKSRERDIMRVFLDDARRHLKLVQE